MANHESACTTSFYERHNDQVSLDEVERILIRLRYEAMKLVTVRDDFPPGLYEALGRLAVAFGRVEYQINKRQIMSLAELDFIPTATTIVCIGPTGVGKSGLATGLLLKALQNGYRALFITAQDLFDDLYASLADRSSRKLIDRLARVPLLCIDEMGYLTLRPEQSNIFFKLMEERYRHRASII